MTVVRRISVGRAAIYGNHSKKGCVAFFKFRYFLLVLVVFSGCFLILSSKYKGIVFGKQNSLPWDHNQDDANVVNSDKKYTIKTKGCTIPAMEPINESIKEYVFYPRGIKPCHNASLSLLGFNRTTIWIRPEMFDHYNVSTDTLSCCYQSFYRPNKIEDIDKYADNRVKYDDCLYFKKILHVKSEFAKVTCKANDKIAYKQYYIFAPKKIFKTHDDHSQRALNKSAYNILILGIDAVSRLNFHRTMPKTLDYLKKKDVIELLGYNKVGDNSFPNLIPLLLGVNVTELKRICVPYNYAKFDNCPFIWEWFKQAGYYTAFGEDNTGLGTFSYFKSGFANTPTDYYLHTFINEAVKEVGSNWRCMNDRHFYKVLLDYIFDLTTNLRDSRLFGFFWEITMSHDILNYPMVMDDNYVDFFKTLESSGYLNETIVFLLSDHGIRWGGIRSTQQGRLEERLPFTYVLTPPSFKENYTKAYNHLKLNSQRLTTPFDIYATLSQLIDLKNIDDDMIESQCRKSYAHERGINLFLPIPSNRTCKAAGIKDHWCTCYRESELPKDSTIAIEAAQYLITYLNELLDDYKQCLRLTLSEIVHATELNVLKSSQGSKGWRELMVVVTALPGGGIFEATLRNETKDWRISGTVSRLNLYGDQSRCVHQAELKPYCYCLS